MSGGAARARGPGRGVPALLATGIAAAAFVLGFAGARALADADAVSPLLDRGAPDLSRVDGAIAKAAAEFGLDADLLRGLVAAESGGRPDAVSKSGAVGLVQLMPATAAEQARALRLDPAKVDLTDPETNLRLGARYLSRLLAELGGEPAFALAAYNAGKTHVLRWRWRAPDTDAPGVVRREGFGETRHHVRRALAFRDAYRAGR